MKEGYFQKKLTELAEQQQKLSSSLTLLEAEIERLEYRIGGLKPIVKRLNDVESFKDLTLDELKKENDSLIQEAKNDLIQASEKIVKEITNKKIDVIQESRIQIKKDEELFKRYAEGIASIQSDIVYVKEFHRLLVMKLVNKGVLSYQEQQEIDKRSSKKVNANSDS
ncbi:MAG: hypothetical protein QCI00_06860 [Candidatus Thermoplasmatota archaeon]|nr:hypothetical protein [Candidatus Thermoplasmatota archaeon]